MAASVAIAVPQTPMRWMRLVLIFWRSGLRPSLKARAIPRPLAPAAASRSPPPPAPSLPLQLHRGLFDNQRWLWRGDHARADAERQRHARAVGVTGLPPREHRPK